MNVEVLKSCLFHVRFYTTHFSYLNLDMMKRQYLFLRLLVLFFAACLPVSCSKNDSQKLEVSKEELMFTVGAATREFTITTTGDWEIEADGLEPYIGGNKGQTNWYTVEPIGGNGNAVITVISKEETAGNISTIRIRYGRKEKRVELRQDTAE